MNSNVSITPDELEREHKIKSEWLAVAQTAFADALKRKEEREQRLKGYGKARLWLNEQKGEITARRHTLAAEWSERIYNGERILESGASDLAALIQEDNLVAICARQVIEVDEVAARDALLVATVDVTSEVANIAQLTADLHRLDVLRAAASVGALEGSVELVKGARSEALARVAYQSVQDREQAIMALQREREIQRAVREKSTGPVNWLNPSA